MELTKNVGSLDRILRIVAGAALILLAATGMIGGWGWIGIIMLATAFLKFCPLYRIIGMDTCKND